MSFHVLIRHYDINFQNASKVTEKGVGRSYHLKGNEKNNVLIRSMTTYKQYVDILYTIRITLLRSK